MGRPKVEEQCLILFMVIENTSYKETKRSEGKKIMTKLEQRNGQSLKVTTK